MSTVRRKQNAPECKIPDGMEETDDMIVYERCKEYEPPYLNNVAHQIEKRRDDLVCRHKQLSDKITTMERSIPALIAYNMLMAGQDCRNTPYCKVLEIMKKCAPAPDPIEKLLKNLKGTVKQLNKETADLHDKIINADIKLEEFTMELASVELENIEIHDKVANLEEEVQRYETPSIHSIRSDDIICLSKIHQLAQEEVSTKKCIKELEEKEILFKEQMNELLTSKDFQNAAGNKTMINRIRELESKEKRMQQALQNNKHKMHQMKKKLMQKEKELESRHGATRGAANVTERSQKVSSDSDSQPCNCPSEPICYCTPQTSTPPKKSIKKKPLNSDHGRPTKTSCSPKIHCQSPPCMKTLLEYPTSKKQSVCRCNCRGKCAEGLSTVPCNCGAPNVSSSDKGYRPKARQITKSNIDSASDEEFCECCSCGCVESDDSS